MDLTVTALPQRVGPHGSEASLGTKACEKCLHQWIEFSQPLEGKARASAPFIPYRRLSPKARLVDSWA